MLRGAVLYAKNLERLVAFYAALGNDVVVERESDFAIIQAHDNTELIILQTPEHVSAQIEITNPPVVRSETPLKLIFTVSSIEQALESVFKRGGALLAEASQWKFRSDLVQDIVDPEGNVVQLWQSTLEQPV